MEKEKNEDSQDKGKSILRTFALFFLNQFQVS